MADRLKISSRTYVRKEQLRANKQHHSRDTENAIMVAIVNRRALIGSIISSTLCSSSVLVEDVAKFIITSTPIAFREAVQRSNHFLYRGQDFDTKLRMAGRICNEEPDLLTSGTYEDTKALSYFQCLQEYLTKEGVAAKPSTGHVGTSVRRDAREWGEVVSVWPLGTTLWYVYPKNAKTFFPDCVCGESEYVMNDDLENALRNEREVLFASWYETSESAISSSFLVVPQKYDERLKSLLESLNYGLN